jgi:hypothetical protein
MARNITRKRLGIRLSVGCNRGAAESSYGMVFAMRAMAVLLLAAASFAADGTFTGKWSSSRNDASGEIRLKLNPPVEVTFSLNGQQVKTTVATFKTQPGAEEFEIDYDFSLEGYKLRSSLKGVVKGEKMTGQYTTKSLEDSSSVDAGNFEATSK